MNRRAIIRRRCHHLLLLILLYFFFKRQWHAHWFVLRAVAPPTSKWAVLKCTVGRPTISGASITTCDNAMGNGQLVGNGVQAACQ